MRTTGYCFGLMLLLSACGNAGGEQGAAIDREKVKQEIQARENQFAELYNKGEMKSIGYFADDAISYSQNKQPLVGKGAIINYLKAGLDSSAKGTRISFTTNDVFVSNDGRQVVEVGYYNFQDSTGESLNTGNYMVLFEKRGDQYVCLRDMSASDTPLD